MCTMSDEAMLRDLGIDVESSREEYELERSRCGQCGDVCVEGAYEIDLDDERVCRPCQALALTPDPEEPEERQALISEEHGSSYQLLCYAALFFVGFAGLVHTFVHPQVVVTLAVAVAMAGFGTHRVHHAH